MGKKIFPIFFFGGGGGRLEIHVLVGNSGVSMPANQYNLIVFVTIFVIKKCGKSNSMIFDIVGEKKHEKKSFRTVY